MFPLRGTSLAANQSTAEGKLKMSKTLSLSRLQTLACGEKAHFIIRVCTQFGFGVLNSFTMHMQIPPNELNDFYACLRNQFNIRISINISIL